MFGLGMGEIVVILIVALLFLGPDKLPDAAKQIGKTIRELRKHTDNLRDTIDQDEHLGGTVRELQNALRGESPLRRLQDSILGDTDEAKRAAAARAEAARPIGPDPREVLADPAAPAGGAGRSPEPVVVQTDQAASPPPPAAVPLAFPSAGAPPRIATDSPDAPAAPAAPIDDGVVAGGPDPARPVGGGGRSPHLSIEKKDA